MAKILPVFLSFAACGNRCIFCDQNVISGVTERVNLLQSATSQIKRWQEVRGSWDEVAFFGGNFGDINKETRLDLYKIVRACAIPKIRFSTRPDTIRSELIAEIKGEGIHLVELGIQSLSDDVLALNGRPYGKNDALEAVEKICGVTSCGVQLMTGMFGQSYLSSVDDSRLLSDYPLQAARIYPTIVIKGTRLEELMQSGEYIPTKLADIIAVVAGMFINFSSKEIKVIRMGLPLDGGIEKQAIGGAIHKSFGDLVKTFVVALYCQTGEKTSFAGYKSFVRQKFSNLFESCMKTDFNKISRILRSSSCADNKRYFEGQAYKLARELESAANNG